MYYELCAYFDDRDFVSIQWALDAEELVPERWDDKARQALSSVLTIEEQATLYHK